MLRKAVPMDSYSGKPNNDYSMTPSEPSVVIPCPSCDTKFAVESSLIAAIEKPKFHCSRCDAVFAMPATLSEDLKADNTPSMSTLREIRQTTPSQRSGESFVQDSFINQDSQTSRGIRASDFSLAARDKTSAAGWAQSQATSRTSPDRVNPQERLVLPGDTQGRLSHNISSNKPVQSFIGHTSPANDNRTADQSTARQFISESAASFHVQEKMLPENIPGENLEAETAPEHAPQQASRRNRYDIDELLAHSARTQSTPTHTMSPTPDHSSSRYSGETSTAPIGRARTTPLSTHEALPTERTRRSMSTSGHWQGSAVLSIPLFGTLAMLVGFSYFAYLTPSSSTFVAKSIVPTFLRGPLPQLPPNELVVKGLSLHFEKTQTKEIIPVIRGSLVNGTERELDGVVLQGLGFDRNGEVVLDAQAPLRSALGRENIGDLPLNTVQKFQNSLSARSSSIKPGEQVPFTLALLSKRTSDTSINDGESSAKAMKFFSARVFSTK
jgi:predicted Zn finger-like uncharacterized protein